MPKKRLYRSQQDKMIAGVCGGIAEYFDWDPVWVRLAAVLLVFMHGFGLIAYIVCWIVIPKNPNQTPKEKDKTKKEKTKSTARKAEKAHATPVPPPRKSHGVLLTIIIILLVLILVAGLGVAAQFLFCEAGSGNLAQETRDHQDFTEVELAGSGDLLITQGENYSVVIETDDNLLGLYETRVRGDTLEIHPKRIGCIRKSSGLTVYVTMPEVEGFSIAGSGTVKGEELTADELSVEIAGSGTAYLDVNVTRLETEIAGSGDAYLSGTAKHHEINIAGSGDIHAFSLETETTDVDIAGSGDAELTVERELDVNIAGSGDIRYKGTPHVSQSVAGSGDIQQV